MLIRQGGPNWGINCKFKYFSEFEFIFEMALGYKSGVGGHDLMKKPEAKFLVSVSLSTHCVLSALDFIEIRSGFKKHIVRKFLQDNCK